MHPEFPQRLRELVERAKEIRRKGIHGVDPEEYTKQHLIEPLLKALDYDSDDIRKEFHILGDQCDYLLETRRPLLFVEAKSLLDKSKNLFDAHREQVLRYLRNYRISPEQVAMEKPITWLLLTNFAQLHFIRVNEQTPTFSFRLQELEDRADELWELLAPDRLEAGRIEEFYDQEQKADLDQRFLVDLKQWRLILANGFGIRNQKASLADLTSASQQLLDRFLFCRMLETHGLIEYNKLARAFVGYEEFFGQHSPKTFAEFLRESLFEEIRAKFNTELFVQPQLCDTLQIDNAFLAAIIGHTPLPAEVALTCGIEQGQGELFTFRHLYSYDFSRMSHDIMGAVYERFLAHKLGQKNGRVTIEETKALRKKEGIYYTPRYIVDYLITHTLGEKTAPILDSAIALLQEKKYRDAHAKIRELSQIKILDPAMGSGSFLLRAFDYLLQCYDRYNRACRDIKQTGRIRETPGELFGERYEVAEEVFNPAFYVPSENIFGVDLDPQAVELARLNLWMRLMIAERDLMRERLRLRQPNGGPLSLLPPLANNLKRGNSLISDPAVADDAAFDWQKEFSEIITRGGFNVVVGNPPYERIQTMKKYAPESVDFLKKNYETAKSGNFDIYVCFVEKGLSLLNEGGLFGYIVPHKFFQAGYGANLRQLLSKGEHLREIVSFGHQQVFSHVSTYTCLLLLSKEPTREFIYREAFDLDAWKLNGNARSAVLPSSVASSAAWTFLAGKAEEKLLDKLRAVPERLESVAERIFQGLKTSADEIYIVDELERRATRVRVYSHETGREYWLEPDLLHPLVKGGDSRRYSLADPRRLILFPYAATEKREIALIAEDTLKKKYPLTWQYLLANRTRLEQREGGRMIGDQWYAFGRNQALDVISQPKIFTPDLSLRAAYSLDETGDKFFTGGVAGGYGIVVRPKVDRIYILALLNSRLLDWFVAKTGTTLRGGWHSYEARFIRRVPVILPGNRSTPEISKLGVAMMKLSQRR
jgi:type I restriction-modification system DNA methylase subunit